MPIFDTSAFFRQFLYDEKNPLLFNHGFFVFFFVAFMTLYYVFREKIVIRRYLFCFFSLYFFYKASGSFVLLVILSAIVDFFLSNAIFKTKKINTKKLLLFFSILFNLGMLIYFKYTNFFISLSNDVLKAGFHPLNILLPVGISFYTFENISYTMDVYRGELKPVKKFSEYLLFLSFFPKLVMGPIVRAHDFIPQINQPYVQNQKDFSDGFYLIITGLFKKLIISDYLTLNYVDMIFDAPERYSGIESLFAVYGYAAVIYCDFSGYSDVALGIGRWLGFKLPVNFNSPYQSLNITDFWRRWHISLSSWLRDYLYIPLGGNRKGSIGTFVFIGIFFLSAFLILTNSLHYGLTWSLVVCLLLLLIFLIPPILERKKGGLPANFNLLTTMFLGGLWHGASLNFIFWGALHGIGLGIHKCWILLIGKKSEVFSGSRWYNLLMGLVTFHFVCFCWIFFKASDFDTATAMILQIQSGWSVSVTTAFLSAYSLVLIMLVLAVVTHLTRETWIEKIKQKLTSKPVWFFVLILFLFLLAYGYIKSEEQVMPIYLQF